ncbi:DUF6493 family protein [Buchananella hordeovulneris]|uniref:HEAT repeat domain-containing protein n=1 Tax=Buchananella hordeovulneris TaxID=52770 RepID=A0A1Q5PX40_9ACTO|nr:DUF6493 family protein [Buchananella hordeovulneris]MDO5080325.1 DUF6493 family protein [Buchananella hordeovulneris]OKL52183.1 hypothetical protein BSZ40_04595 [Buchananella hordeovulneris]RRD44878.1 hypothetical protein EII13_01570 [Buchananella hordeovulneris]
MQLTDRRDALRAALKLTDTSSAALAVALADASPAERAALAKTLPASRLLRQEGPTPRAVFALVALGRKQSTVVEYLAPWEKPDEVQRQWEALGEVVYAAAVERDTAWVTAFCAELVEWCASRPHLWELALRLLRARGIYLRTPEYLQRFCWQLGDAPWEHDDAGRPVSTGPVEAVLRDLRAFPEALERELWDLFAFPELGSHGAVVNDRREQWNHAFAAVAAQEPGFRQRLLDESLGCLLRDWSAKNITLALQVQRLLAPTPTEITARADRYLAVLTTTPSTAVTLAQGMLTASLPTLDPTALLTASPAVLWRKEKKLRRAQIDLLAALTTGHPQTTSAVVELVTSVLPELPTDLQAHARKRLPTLPSPASTPTPSTPQPPPPTLQPLPAAAALPEFVGDADCAVAVCALLHERGDGRELPRVLTHLRRRPQTIDAAARKLADEASQWGACPLASVAAYVRALATGVELQLPAGRYADRVALRSCEPVPPHWQVEMPPGYWQAHTHGTQPQRLWFGDRFWDSHAPRFLWDVAVADACRGGQLANSPLPPLPARWELRYWEPTERQARAVLFLPRLPWWHASEVTAEGFAAQWADTGPLATEYAFRFNEARWLAGYDALAAWAGWLLSANPDVLAAQFFPAIFAATRVVNVRGVADLISALGNTTQVPGAPALSALALATGTKEPHQRAATAEALANLATHDLLNPTALAAHTLTHLQTGHLLAGRLATTLQDTASISPLAAWRTQETLTQLLPHLAPIRHAHKLVTLLACLAHQQQTPIPIPPALQPQTKTKTQLASALKQLPVPAAGAPGRG